MRKYQLESERSNNGEGEMEGAMNGKMTRRVLTTCSSSNIHEQYLDSTQHAIDLISGVGSERF